MFAGTIPRLSIAFGCMGTHPVYFLEAENVFVSSELLKSGLINIVLPAKKKKKKHPAGIFGSIRGRVIIQTFAFQHIG